MTEQVGIVTGVNKYRIVLDGLPTAKLQAIIQNEDGIRAVITNLYPDFVEALSLDDGEVTPGQIFKLFKNELTFTCGKNLLGRAVNPLGVPIDGKGSLEKEEMEEMPIDRKSYGIGWRRFITEQLITGITAIDTLMPIAKGQRELILGDPRSGKSDFLKDLILNQKESGMICIYASIGKPLPELKNLIEILTTNDAMEFTAIIAASSSDASPLTFLTPHVAMTLAEYFQSYGKDVLVILDDLGVHARIYREIALLGGRAPGRESYPGDMFYTHAHLLERAGSFTKDAGGGSITAVPVAEINLDELTTLIPTNLMATTDGHLLFRSSLHREGIRPALDIPLSVSRVGPQTQISIHAQIASRIRSSLALLVQLETVRRFASELPTTTQRLILQGEQIREILKQEIQTSIPINIQTILLALIFTSLFYEQSVDFVRINKEKIIQAFLKNKKLSSFAQSLSKFKTDVEMINNLERLKPFIQGAIK